MPAEPITITNRLLAVVDSDADHALAALAAAGIPDGDVVLLQGDGAAARLPSRATAGRWDRARRFLTFIAVDQAVDLAWYEAALTGGRAVLVVRAPTPAARAAAIEALGRSGAHFMNHYGRFATQDVSPWRGTPPPIPWTHHR